MCSRSECSVSGWLITLLQKPAFSAGPVSTSFPSRAAEPSAAPCCFRRLGKCQRCFCLEHLWAGLFRTRQWWWQCFSRARHLPHAPAATVRPHAAATRGAPALRVVPGPLGRAVLMGTGKGRSPRELGMSCGPKKWAFSCPSPASDYVFRFRASK